MKSCIKIIKAIFIVIIALIIVAVAAVLARKQYRISKNETRIVECESIPGIICIGDSLTHGPEKSYPYNLERRLIEDGYFMPVYNLGIGGENTVTIAGRLGGIPYKVKAFDMPEDGESVRIEFIEDEKHLIKPFLQLGNSAINPVVINGKAGELSISEDKSEYYFTRIDDADGLSKRQEELLSVNSISSSSDDVSGRQDECSDSYGFAADSNKSYQAYNFETDPYQVETYGATAYQDGIYIVFMGENLGWTSIDELIIQQKSIIDRQIKNKDKYLIIGLTTGDSQSWCELEEAMTEEYGNKYINLRSYFTGTENVAAGGYIKMDVDGDESEPCNILEDAKKYGVQFSDIDIQDMANGKVPACLLEDKIHYNDAGYALLADKVYARMISLGYFDNIKGSADSFNSKWGLVNKLEIWVNDNK